MRQTSVLNSLRIEHERRARIVKIRFLACLVLRAIQVPEYEKGLVPVIGTAATHNNLAAVVEWIGTSWRGPLEPPREVARVLTTYLVAILVDSGP